MSKFHLTAGGIFCFPRNQKIIIDISLKFFYFHKKGLINFTQSRMTADRRSEIYLKGIPASPGIAMGPIFLYRDHTHEPELRIIPVSKLDDEISRFQRAIRASRDYLKKIHRETDQKYGNDFAEIVQIQISILDDEIFLKEVEKLIREHRYNAAYATFKVFQEKKEHFLKLSDDYMRERAFDIQTLKRLILKKLSGKKLDINYKKKSIIVTDNINPADIIRLHHKDILGFCTNVGGKNSHTAIVARSLGVPAVVGTEYITTAAKSGDYLILNGNDGVVIINPTPETIKEYSEKQRKFLILENGLLQDAMKPARTRDGKNITVMANLEFIEELEQFRNSGAEGIGLYRTEGLFFSGGTLPGEEFQTQTYIKFAENAAPYEVIIRTLDVGGDKILPDLADLPESNPFLGWRAIRFCLDHKEVFVPQLKAILQANLHGNIKLLLPMISALEEVRQFKEILKEAITLLKNEHKEFNADLEIGIMVEIPSAAIMIDSFLDEVDFISIGTNDLIQYTLAVDRANEKVSYLYNHYHPSLLNLIKKVIDAAKSKMKPVGMCGEMAGDPVAVPLLIGMGLENFSATPSRIPEIKNV
ncbi:MAG: phosphoenolpyruvate--protein phosphotransferase, partial [Calditrichaeota bacterium]